MTNKTHHFFTIDAARAKLRELRAAGIVAHIECPAPACFEVRELFAIDAPASAVAAHIGSLANATLEPLDSDAPADGRTLLDARDVDPWALNFDR